MADHLPPSRSDSDSGSEPGFRGDGESDSEWTMRLAGELSWSRILMVGTWLVVVASMLVWNDGPFWRDGVAWFEHAREAAARGDWPAALEGVRNARKLQPEDAGLATFEGHALLRLGEPGPAAEAFEEARTLDPEGVEPTLGVAEARLVVGDTAEAREALQALDDAAPLAAEPSVRLRHAGLAEAAGDPALALASLVGPPPIGALNDRIRLALRLERWPLAVDLLREALEADPRSSVRRRELAWALQADVRVVEADEEYRALRRDGILDGEAAVRYAWLLNERGRHGEALELLMEEVVEGALADTGESGPGEPMAADLAELTVRTAVWADRIEVAERRLESAAEELDPTVRAELRREVSSARSRGAAAERDRGVDAEAEAVSPGGPGDAPEESEDREGREAGRNVDEEVDGALHRDEKRREEAADEVPVTPPEGPVAALAFWWDRLETNPTDSVARRETVALLESFQRFHEASEVLLAGRAVDEVREREELLHLARLGRWAGEPETAVRWLERLESVHGEVPGAARLVLARLLASHERLDRASEQYGRYVDEGGAEPVALERARVELGREERFGAAVGVAREAVRELEAAGGPALWEARLVLAAALRYDGRWSESEALLRELARRPMDEVGDPATGHRRPGGADEAEALKGMPTTPIRRARVARLRSAMRAPPGPRWGPGRGAGATPRAWITSARAFPESAGWPGPPSGFGRRWRPGSSPRGRHGRSRW